MGRRGGFLRWAFERKRRSQVVSYHQNTVDSNAAEHPRNFNLLTGNSRLQGTKTTTTPPSSPQLSVPGMMQSLLVVGRGSLRPATPCPLARDSGPWFQPRLSRDLNGLELYSCAVCLLGLPGTVWLLIASHPLPSACVALGIVLGNAGFL